MATLTARDALYIAAQHGLSLTRHKKLIRDCIIEARAMEPQKSAVRHFDESMTKVARALLRLYER